MGVSRVDGPGKLRLKNLLTGLQGVEGAVGFFPSARYEDGTTVATAAATAEFGDESNNVPPRPFFRPAIANNRNEWAHISKTAAKAVLNGSVSGKVAMERITFKAVGDVKDAIKDVTNPPLQPSTIKARLQKLKDKKTVGSLDKPLVETALMLNSVTSEVTSTK